MIDQAPKQGVILLHGIVGAPYQVWPLARMLTKQGFVVKSISYPSTRQNLSQLVDYVHNQAQTFIEQLTKLHFVGYSMGGLLCRAYIHRYPPKNLGRVVQLGSPNYGSEVADKLQKNLLYQKVFGPSGQQLTTYNRETQNLMGTVAYELGGIAGNRAIDLLSSHWIGKPNDGRVSVDSTRVEGQADHIVLPVCHEGFCYFPKVQRQVQHFINHGSFVHSSDI